MRPALAALVGVAVLVTGFLLRPVTPRPGDQATGDRELIATVRQAGHPGERLTVIVLDGDSTRVARFDGVTGETRYEVGSFTKAITGLLLADAVERGELTLDDQLGTHLDVGTGPASRVTLRQLATHSSGLPRLNTGLGDLPRDLWSQLTAANPYRGTPAELAADTAGITPGEQTFAYSNLGSALAGHATAAAAGTGYPELARDRLFGPLELGGTAVQTGPPLVEPGRDLAGRRQEPWPMDGMAPAGAVVSTPDDMTALARALLAGRAPGATALTPIADTDDPDERIGLFWLTDAYPDGHYAWHNGATGGYTSFVAVDRERQRAVIVLNAVSDGATPLGRDLMVDPDTWSRTP